MTSCHRLDEEVAVRALLAFVRTHLHMDVAFVSEFLGDQRRFRQVDPVADVAICAGTTEPRDGTFCDAIARGELPEVLPDLGAVAVPPDLVPLVGGTVALGSHIGVPVFRRDGELYGTLCAFSPQPNARLRQTDLFVMRSVAEVISDLIGASDQHDRRRRATAASIDALLDAGGPAIVLQPIVDLRAGCALGVEALSRFPAGTPNPAEWFAAAHDLSPAVGVGLEVRAVSNALTHLPAIDGFLALNVSASALLSAELSAVLAEVPLRRLVLEITEHDPIQDYERVGCILAPFRRAGLRVAVDDTGAGFASMRHVLKLAPDIIKLDVSLVRGIDASTPQQAFASATLAFADRTGAIVLAEGIETQAELDTLVELGVRHGQGYFLGRPAPPPP